MKRLFLLLFFLLQAAFAQSFYFDSTGNIQAGNILKQYISDEFNLEDIDVIAQFYDIGTNGQNAVLGIVKSDMFYSLEGYKLIVLKKEENIYKPVKCDIYFDNLKEVTIEGNKITYYKSIFYKNKKYYAQIKNKEIKTTKSINDVFKDKKVQNIQQLTSHTQSENKNIMELSDFKTSVQRSVNIKYKNLNEKLKHYLDMK